MSFHAIRIDAQVLEIVNFFSNIYSHRYYTWGGLLDKYLQTSPHTVLRRVSIKFDDRIDHFITVRLIRNDKIRFYFILMCYR